MSGGFPGRGSLCNANGIGKFYDNTTLNAAIGNTVNVKGSWTQVWASTPCDATFVELQLSAGSNGSSTTLFDLGVGPAGSEVPIWTNIMLNEAASWALLVGKYGLPINVPAGSRLAIRAQGATAGGGGGNVFVGVTIYDGDFEDCGFSGAEGVGVSTSNTQGTAITCGNGVWSAWTQLVASTSRDYAGFSVALDTQNANVSYSNYVLVQIAVGASGSEQMIISSVAFLCDGKGFDPMCSLFIPVEVPAGSRLSARAYAIAAAPVIGVSLMAAYK